MTVCEPEFWYISSFAVLKVELMKDKIDTGSTINEMKPS